MRAHIEDRVLFIQAEDVPHYKQRGSVVRNNYFWALRSISARSPFDRPWEFESEVWFALCRMLVSFFESGYLGIRETQLEFPDGTEVPELLRPVATWVAKFEPETLLDGDDSDRQSLESEGLSEPTARTAEAAPSVAALNLGNDPSKDPANDLAPDPGKDIGAADNSPQRRVNRSTRLG